MKQKKFITPHRDRVRRAIEWISKLPEKISIFDREAFVEFYLLEDVVRLYEYRLEQEEKKEVHTPAGERAKRANIEKFKAVLKIFNSAIEVAWGQITSGNYSKVWKAIPEHALMIAANNVKNLPILSRIAVDMLNDLYDETLISREEEQWLDQSLEDLDSHEANVRKVKDIPSREEIDEIIKAVEVVIPDGKTASRIKSKLN